MYPERWMAMLKRAMSAGGLQQEKVIAGVQPVTRLRSRMRCSII